MVRKFVIAAGCAVVALLAALPASAGFKIQEVDPEFPAEVTTSWFQGGKVRVEGALEGLTVIVDVKAGEGWLVDKAGKRYAGGKVADLAEELLKLDEPQADDEGDEGEEGGTGGQAEAEADKPREVTVKDLGAGERLLGYETRRQQVFVDGELLEELWLAPKLEVANEVDLSAFSAMLQKMLGGGPAATQGYEESEKYRAVRALGYPLRQVLYFVGEKSTLEVTTAAAEAIPAADFAVPSGFTKVGYGELLLGEAE